MRNVGFVIDTLCCTWQSSGILAGVLGLPNEWGGMYLSNKFLCMMLEFTVHFNLNFVSRLLQNNQVKASNSCVNHSVKN